MIRILRISTVILVCSFLPSLLAAEENSAEHHHKNKIGVFGGITHSDSDTEPTVGLEYIRMLTDSFFLGGVYEYAGGEIDTSLAGLLIGYEPVERWSVSVAPAVEFDSEESIFVVRVGTAYEFEISPEWSLGPDLSFDLNRQEEDVSVVFGLILVRGF